MKAKPRKGHGLYRVMSRVMLEGFNGIDRRTAVARDLMQWREGLIAALGGQEHLSLQRMTLVDLACRTKALVDHTDSYLLSLSSVINRRARSHFPIVAQRERLADSLMRILTTLGLDRVPAPVPTLAEYLESKEREESTAQQDGAVHDDAPAEEGETKP
jgi:hypothetical protein